ncbi:MAG TPA: Ig-like domain-containing protein [Archangium sp.]|nr:Ig-like domain-containing protein [Archangium sp.]
MNRYSARPRGSVLAWLLIVAWAGCAPLGEPAEQASAGTGQSEAGLGLTTGAMAASRYNFSTTVLADGRVLVAGGTGSSGLLSSAEIYDPATGVFSTAATLYDGVRTQHAAVRLNNGRVLVVGGRDAAAQKTQALSYNPADGFWRTHGNLLTGRTGHTATLLPDGRVLVTGGYSGYDHLATCELFNPSTGTFTSAAPMKEKRTDHTATLLPNGKVLVVSGLSSTTAELYDPATNTWSYTGGIVSARRSHQALLLTDGRVLIAGGTVWATGATLSSAELYDPATGTWSSAGSMSHPRQGHAAVVLPTGRAVVFGGTSGSSGVNSTIEQFDPTTGTWGVVGTMLRGRTQHGAALLGNGRVLLAGGMPHVTGSGNTELYTPETSCVPLTCAGQGMNCGTLFDGCGNLLACGTCASGQTCLGSNVCTSFTGTPVYDTTRKVPRCTQAGPLCDSGTLLNGRGPVGPEANAPNTLSSGCLDGTAGTYRSTESLERLRVITVDGSPLAVGKQVRIEASVYVSPSYSADKLDLYYATHADAPVWRFIATLSADSSGPRTFSTTYTLPTGGSLQAIRGVFRYGGSAGACVQGTNNDHDDLVFPVNGPTAPPDYPPTVQLTAPASSSTLQGTVLLKANATDDFGVSRVEFYANSKLLGSDTSPPYEYAWDTTLSANGHYDLTARAHDTSGLVTTSSAWVPVTLANDFTPPTVSLTKPTAGQMTNSDLSMAVTASDDIGLTLLEVYVDGQLASSQAYNRVWNASWNPTWSISGAAQGAHTVFARAVDGAGRSTQTASVTFHVDTLPPTTAVITSPVNGANVSWQSVTVTADAVDAQGIEAVSLYVDDVALDGTGTAPYTLHWSSASASPGAHTLTIRAYDLAGNSTMSAPVTVYIPADVVPPTVAIQSPASGATVSGQQSVMVTAQDDRSIGRVELLVDGTLVSTSSSASGPISWNTTTSATGSHVLVARAYDTAGNQTDSAPVQVIVDNTAPPPSAGTATYDATRKAPGCSALDLMSCDSGSLLNGRGPLGPESNAPNTLFTSCQDGASGTYHADESLDRLKVSTLDGSALAAGKTVRIEATVWPWSSGSADALDLYYTANANSPSWTYLTTLVPPGSGARVLSTTYTLPSGALQAVRGVFRYGGSLGACAQSSYTDHDDLFFSVR